jgi:hypothetical protein
MINKKRPKLITVTGSVNITNIGLTNRFKRLNTTATMMAVIKPSTDTLGSTFAKIITATALNRILKISFMDFGFNLCLFFIKKGK